MSGGTFPTSVPSYEDTQGNERLSNAGNGAGLSTILDNLQIDVTALSTKLGTGSSTATSGTVLKGTGSGVIGS